MAQPSPAEVANRGGRCSDLTASIFLDIIWVAAESRGWWPFLHNIRWLHVALPVTLPSPTNRMRKSRIGRRQELLAIADPAIVFTPRHLQRVGVEILSRDMMMRSDLGATETREEALGLIGVALIG